jgi:hypothetical protein
MIKIKKKVQIQEITSSTAMPKCPNPAPIS